MDLDHYQTMNGRKYTPVINQVELAKFVLVGNEHTGIDTSDDQLFCKDA